MDPINLIGLQPLMDITSGHPDMTVGIIDGPIDLNHPAFQASNIKTIRDSQFIACNSASSLACSHGTFVAGILCAKRGLDAPAICPGCKIILNPIFKEGEKDMILPSTTPDELSNTIIETVDAGVRIINLSLGLSTSSLTRYDTLQQAYDYSLQKGVIIVAAAGNQGHIGNISLINHQWPIPVAACDEYGRLDPTSNFGPSIGNKGLMAPGVNIRSAYPGGQYTRMSGTSFSAPFVTGAIALLWSIFRNATPGQIKYSLMANEAKYHRNIIPPLLNVDTALNFLKKSY